MGCCDSGGNYALLPPRLRHIGGGWELQSGFPALPKACRTSCHAPPPGPTAGQRPARWARFNKSGAPSTAGLVDEEMEAE